MKLFLKKVYYGILAWLIPFVTSFLFYTQDGGLTIDVFLFKSIMIVVGTISAAILLTCYFKKIKKNYLKDAIVLGIVLFGVNILLDLVVLLPMSGMNIDAYFSEIGLRYLGMPAMSMAIGASLENKAT